MVTSSLSVVAVESSPDQTLTPRSVAETGKFVSAEGALKVAVDHGIDQVAIADPEHLHLDRRGVDADHRDTALASTRQHVGPAGDCSQQTAFCGHGRRY